MLSYECKIEKTSPIARELTISVKPESIRTYIDKQFDVIQKRAKIKGFRPGKAPLTVIKREYEQNVKADVFSKLIEDTYWRALEENKIDAIGSPQIEAKSGASLNDGETLTFVAKVEVLPEIKIENLSKIKVSKPSSELKDDEVEKYFEQMRKSRSEVVPNEGYTGPAKAGDWASISFKGSVDGEFLEGMTAENRLVQLGEKQFLEDFEKNVLGLNQGESKKFKITFPDDYAGGDKKIAGKEAEFEVTLHEFKKEVMPELNDDLAKEFKAESVLDLRKKVTETLSKNKEREAKNQLKQSLIDELLKLHDFDVPSHFIGMQTKYLVDENSRYFKSQGFSTKMIEDYQSSTLDKTQETARRQVRTTLLLDQIAKSENIKIEDSDLEHEYSRIAAEENLSAEEVKKFFDGNSNALRELKFRLKEEKAIEHVLSQAKVTPAKD